MKLGKVSQTILKRSVLNLIKYRGEHSYQAPTMEDPTVKVKVDGADLIVSAMSSVTGDQKDIGIYAIVRSVNDLLCRGAMPSGVQVMIQLPEHAYESRLKSMVQSMEEHCESIGVPILNVQVSVTSRVNTSIVTVSAIGQACQKSLGNLINGHSDMEVVMIGEVGLEGALRLLSEKREVLEKRFSPTFLRNLESKLDEWSNSVRSTAKAVELDEMVMHQVPESGILGGLWELAEASGVGVEVQLRNLPISQEVIEVCEYLGVNPYRLGAAGSILVITSSGESLVEAMESFGYKAAIIGKTTNSNEKILCNGEDVRHLERPTPNELYKVLEEGQEKEC